MQEVCNRSGSVQWKGVPLSFVRQYPCPLCDGTPVLCGTVPLSFVQQCPCPLYDSTPVLCATVPLSFVWQYPCPLCDSTPVLCATVPLSFVRQYPCPGHEVLPLPRPETGIWAGPVAGLVWDRERNQDLLLTIVLVWFFVPVLVLFPCCVNKPQHR